MPKINKSFVDQLEFVESGQKIIRDSDLTGFAIRLTVKSKVYVVERRKSGKLHRVVLGRHTDITAAEARAKAQQILADIASGRFNQVADAPAQVEQKSYPTLGESLALYLKEKQLKPLSIRTYQHCMNAFLPDWLGRVIFEINRTEVQERHEQLTAYSPSQANLTMQVFRAVWNHAYITYSDDDSPITKVNPVKILEAKKSWNHIKPRRGRLIGSDIPEFFKHTQDYIDESSLRDDGTKHAVRDMLIFIMLTGCRRNEAESLAWQNVDLKHGTVMFLDPKNGVDHVLPVGHYLLDLLIKRHAKKHSEWVFASSRSECGHVVSAMTALKRINEKTGVQKSQHDLRRTFASIANHLDYGHYTIKRLLNHISGDVTANYVQVSMSKLREAMNAIEAVYLGSSQPPD
ncbi:MAG: integrase family protein [Pseudomonadota bacterium]|nr:integrase family protein [Pseudomonadota bacterium]